ncbi:MAG TPA: hypothetical protein VEL77_15090 [Rugosimonospora sp.]|nr:hypothetical protein [Rugosimonospora sp.]
MRKQAFLTLEGVGDEQKGQWEEHGQDLKAYHLRRRLSDAEQKLAGGLVDVDIRNSPEYGIRRAAMQPYLPPQYADWQE